MWRSLHRQQKTQSNENRSKNLHFRFPFETEKQNEEIFAIDITKQNCNYNLEEIKNGLKVQHDKLRGQHFEDIDN